MPSKSSEVSCADDERAAALPHLDNLTMLTPNAGNRQTIMITLLMVRFNTAIADKFRIRFLAR